MKTVILAAGFGSRLWPLSTSEKPKQFLPLINGESLIAYTYRQMLEFTLADELYVLTLKGHENHIQKQIPEIDASRIISVPARHGTLSHSVFALRTICKTPDEPVLFRAVDHVLRNPEEFVQSIQAYTQSVADNCDKITLLCTEYTSYSKNAGYALVGESEQVQAFVEKPDIEKLAKMEAEGRTLRAPIFFATSISGVTAAIKPLKATWKPLIDTLVRSDKSALGQSYMALPVIDITRDLFEKTPNMQAHVIAYDYIDVGQFSTVYDLNGKDENGNVLSGKVIQRSCTNCLLINETDEPMVAISLSKAVAVQTKAGSLTALLSDVDKIKNIYLNELKDQGS